MRRISGILAPLFAFASLGLAGCGPDIEEICVQTQDCIGGNEADIDACIAVFSYQAERADIEGCNDEYDAYFECAEVVARCRSEDTGVPCNDDDACRKAGYTRCTNDGTCQVKFYGFEDDDDCKLEESALDQCL